MGFGRELFTDTGQYVLRFDKDVADQEIQARLEKGVGINDELKKVAEESSESQTRAMVKVESSGRGLTLDQRAILLATAMTIDIDYFSRHGGGGMHMPMLWMPLPGMGGGGAEAPPVEGLPGAEGSGGVSTGGSDAPMASPEYGDSPGVDYPSGSGFDSPMGGGYGEGEVMQDPWSNPPQSEEGGGFLSGLFGGESDW